MPHKPNTSLEQLEATQKKLREKAHELEEYCARLDKKLRHLKEQMRIGAASKHETHPKPK